MLNQHYSHQLKGIKYPEDAGEELSQIIKSVTDHPGNNKQYYVNQQFFKVVMT